MNRQTIIPSAGTATEPVEITIERFALRRPIRAEEVAFEQNDDLDVECRKALSAGAAEGGILLIELDLDGESIDRVQLQGSSDPSPMILDAAIRVLQDLSAALWSLQRADEA